MRRERSVLIVTTAFPPTAAVGTHRILKFCKFLPEFGWRPVVLTLQQALYPRDERLAEQVAGSIPVRRTRCLRRFSPPNLVASAGGSTSVGGGESQGWLSRRVHRARLALRHALNFPDRHNSWIPFAVMEGLRVVAEEEIRVVISSSPPVSCHLIARLISTLTGVPQIADFRDLWTQNEKYALSGRPAWLQSCERGIERFIVDRCHAAVTTSEGFTRKIQSGAPTKAPTAVVTITNGIDRDDFRGIRSPKERSDKFTIFHPGSFYGQRNPTFFFGALDRWMSERPERRITTRLLLAGDTRSVDLESVSRDVRRVLEIHGYLPHHQVLEQLWASDVLLLVLGFDSAGREAIPAKLFEYIASRKPVLALVPDGDAAALLKRVGVGEVITRPDEQRVRQALDCLYEDWMKGAGPRDLDVMVPPEIDRRGLTKRLATILDRAAVSPGIEEPRR